MNSTRTVPDILPQSGGNRSSCFWVSGMEAHADTGVGSVLHQCKTQEHSCGMQRIPVLDSVVKI
jgi:hypothetical protein